MLPPFAGAEVCYASRGSEQADADGGPAAPRADRYAARAAVIRHRLAGAGRAALVGLAERARPTSAGCRVGRGDADRGPGGVAIPGSRGAATQGAAVPGIHRVPADRPGWAG